MPDRSCSDPRIDGDLFSEMKLGGRISDHLNAAGIEGNSGMGLAVPFIDLDDLPGERYHFSNGMLLHARVTE